jgi:hypothetical protein
MKKLSPRFKEDHKKGDLFNQKPRHLSLPFKLSPPRIILVRMLRRRSTILTRGRCFKPMSLKFKLYKMNSNQ